MTTDGERARQALIDALQDELRPGGRREEFELGVDRVLARLWMAGFVVASRGPAIRGRRKTNPKEIT